jgi:hypothetical protein
MTNSAVARYSKNLAIYSQTATVNQIDGGYNGDNIAVTIFASNGERSHTRTFHSFALANYWLELTGFYQA